MSSMAGGSCFDPSSLYCSQAALMGLGGSHGNLQDLQMRPNMMYSNCSGGVPNIILTGRCGGEGGGGWEGLRWSGGGNV